MIIGIDASRARHPQPTGVEIYSDEIIDGLLSIFSKQKTHSIRLYTPKKLPHIPSKLQRILPHRRLWTQRHLSKEMKTNPPDVLFVPSHVLPGNHPPKSVITIHDVAFKEFPSAYSIFQYSYLNWTTKQAVRHAWKIIVPSQAVQDDLERLYGCSPDKIVKIPHGFRPKPLTISDKRNQVILQNFHLDSQDPYIFFVGRLETKKNIGRLIQAFAQFHKNFPEWRLILGGGSGVGFRPLLKALEKEDVLQDVIMPGYLEEDEKQVLLTHAHIFAFPSLAEGFGFPVLEAASYGVPILASRIPALLDFKELVDVFVDPKDIKSITNGIETLAKQRTLHINKSVSNYSWGKAARQTWNVLTSK